MKCVERERTYDIDELYHGQSELDANCLTKVLHGPNERVVTIAVKQRVHQLYFIITAEPCTYTHTHTHTHSGSAIPLLTAVVSNRQFSSIIIIHISRSRSPLPRAGGAGTGQGPRAARAREG